MIEDPLGSNEDEIAMGEEAACDLVTHVKRMKATSTSFEILDGVTLWTVTVVSMTLGKVN
jgi:hypothetical protein